jgi:hypothetical protein
VLASGQIVSLTERISGEGTVDQGGISEHMRSDRRCIARDFVRCSDRFQRQKAAEIERGGRIEFGFVLEEVAPKLDPDPDRGARSRAFSICE